MVLRAVHRGVLRPAQPAARVGQEIDRDEHEVAQRTEEFGGVVEDRFDRVDDCLDDVHEHLLQDVQDVAEQLGDGIQEVGDDLLEHRGETVDQSDRRRDEGSDELPDAVGQLDDGPHHRLGELDQVIDQFLDRVDDELARLVDPALDRLLEVLDEAHDRVPCRLDDTDDRVLDLDDLLFEPIEGLADPVARVLDAVVALLLGVLLRLGVLIPYLLVAVVLLLGDVLVCLFFPVLDILADLLVPVRLLRAELLELAVLLGTPVGTLRGDLGHRLAALVRLAFGVGRDLGVDLRLVLGLRLAEVLVLGLPAVGHALLALTEGLLELRATVVLGDFRRRLGRYGPGGRAGLGDSAPAAVGARHLPLHLLLGSVGVDLVLAHGAARVVAARRDGLLALGVDTGALLAGRLLGGALHLHARRVARLGLLQRLVLGGQPGELRGQLLRVDLEADPAQHLPDTEAQGHLEGVPAAGLLRLLGLDLPLGLLGALDLGLLTLGGLGLLRRVLRVRRGGVALGLALQGLRRTRRALHLGRGGREGLVLVADCAVRRAADARHCLKCLVGLEL